MNEIRIPKLAAEFLATSAPETIAEISRNLDNPDNAAALQQAGFAVGELGRYL